MIDIGIQLDIAIEVDTALKTPQETFESRSEYWKPLVIESRLVEKRTR